MYRLQELIDHGFRVLCWKVGDEYCVEPFIYPKNPKDFCVIGKGKTFDEALIDVHTFLKENSFVMPNIESMD